MLDLGEARARILEAVGALDGEPVPIAAALDRVLAEDVAAAAPSPAFDSSAMDGYAVVAGDASSLALAGESRAGRPFTGVLRAGEAVAISTGAVLPEGADAIVPIERARGSGRSIQVEPSAPGDHVRRAGEDVRAGEVVLRAGSSLGPPELALLASLGHAELACARRPRVAVVVTGDELVPPGLPLGPGQIRDSNATALTAAATRAGAEVVLQAGAADEPAATRCVLARALRCADVVLVSGGVSVGEHDHVRSALDELGVEERFWRLRLKPGKPAWFGTRGRTLVFALPGNPVSALVTFELLARPALRALQGAGADPDLAHAVADAPLPGAGNRLHAVRCRLVVAEDGFRVRATGPQGSHQLSSMLGADALALVPPGAGEAPAGTRVDIVRLDRG